MSSAAATSSTPSAPPPFKASLLARAIAVFSGPAGLTLKYVFLAGANALAVWAAAVLADRGKWPALGVLVLATVGIDTIYMLSRRGAVPAKFLVPGAIFLAAFQLAPVIYTITVAFTDYSTGHILTKSEAIKQIQQNTLAPDESGRTFLMAPGRDRSGKLVLALRDDDNGKTYLGTEKALTQVPASDFTLENGEITAVKGVTLLSPVEVGKLGDTLTRFHVPISNGGAIQPQGYDTAVPLTPTLRYDPAKGFVRISDGVVFADNGRGSFIAVHDGQTEELEPGWKASVGGRNFGRVIHDPLISRPFLRVFAWTVSYATLTVLISFAIGLFVAIALDKPGMRGQRAYRSILVVPYAIPGFLSLLVWSGLLNDDFGVVNRLFHISIPWLFNPWWAKVSIILVSVWLTVPYFFLVSLGALQSIPKELVEAAKVDGGNALQIFRKVTLPLLLVAVAPLLIASFAFNFNNFNNIYLLTAGGPAAADQSIAGATDILISYTYKVAFAAGKGQDYGLASTIAIIIFLIVATISAVSFWRSKSLENIR